MIYEKLQEYKKANESKKIKLYNSKDLFIYIAPEYKGLTKEIVFFIAVDTKNQVKYKKLMSEGGINFSYCETRQILTECLLNDVAGFFLVHNHPSGDVTPSEEDITLTRELKEACKIMRLRFLDHIIINVEVKDFYSLYDNDNFEVIK
jgi:DNA repair protein RadC